MALQRSAAYHQNVLLTPYVVHTVGPRTQLHTFLNNFFFFLNTLVSRHNKLSLRNDLAGYVGLSFCRNNRNNLLNTKSKTENEGKEVEHLCVDFLYVI